MVTTGNGRQKIVIQDVIDKVEQIELAHERHDPEGVELLKDEMYRLVLTGIQDGDFQGLTAKTMARLALSTTELTRS